MRWPAFNLNAVHRFSSGVVLVISLPLLILSFVYADLTVFWSQGPATDYPLFHTPKPAAEVRMHGLLCLVSAIGLTCSCSFALTKSHRHTPVNTWGTVFIHLACLVCLWWDPWHTGTIKHEEIYARGLLSAPFAWLLCLSGVRLNRNHKKRFDLKHNSTTEA